MPRRPQTGPDGPLQSFARPVVVAPLLVIAAIAASAPLVDRGLPTNDESGILVLAVRLLRGAVFYRDLDSYHFPAAPYLLAGWMALFGESVNAARWLAAVVFSGMVLGLYLTAIQLVDRLRAALFGFALLSLKFLAAPAFVAFMYSDLALAFVAFALALFVAHRYQGPTRGLFGVGVLVALATATKQNIGIYLSAVIFVLIGFTPLLLGCGDRPARMRLREIGVYLAGFCAAAVPMLGYFAAEGLLGQLFVSGLLRPLLQYLPTSGIDYLEPLRWWHLGSLEGLDAFPFFVAPYWSMLMNQQLAGTALYGVYWFAGELFTRIFYTSLPVVFGLAAWRWLRAIRTREFQQADAARFAFAASAFAVVFSAFPRADLYHLMSVYPVILLLIFALGPGARAGAAEASGRVPPPRLATALVALLLVVSGALAALSQAQKTHHFEHARADLWIEPSKAWVQSVIGYLESELKPDDRIFVYGHEAYYYFFTDRYYPWPFPWVYPGQVGDAQGRPLARRLNEQPPKLIIRGLMGWPGVPGIPDYTPAVHDVIMLRYLHYEDFFEDHPSPTGEAPPDWAVSVLVRRVRR